MFLTETWLRNHCDPEVYIPNYTIYRADRDRPKKHRGRNSGGSAIYMRDDFSGPTEPLFEFSNGVIEAICLKLARHNLIVCSVYRQPNDLVGGNKSTSDEFATFLEELSNIIEDAGSPTPNLLIAGDFNLPRASWPSCTPVSGASGDEKKMIELLSNFCSNNFLMQIVTQPTHRAGNTLDIILTNNSDAFSFLDVTPTSPISSHYLVKATCSLIAAHRSPRKVNSTSSKFDGLNLFSEKTNWDGMNAALSSLDWPSTLQNLTVTQMERKFISKCEDIAEEHAPGRTANTSRRQRIPRERRVLMRKRTRLRKQYHTAKNTSRVSSIKTKLAEIEGKLQQSHKAQEQAEESQAIDKIKSNSKYFFSYAKRKSTIRYPIGPLEDANGVLKSDPADMANILSAQYASVFSAPSTAASSTGPQPAVTISNIEFDTESIVKAIDELSQNSASGPDRFPAILLKKCKYALCHPLYLIWRKSMDEGEIPQILKSSVITPIYKGGSRGLAKNYRPVALTSHLIKVFEKIVRRKIVEFLESGNLMNPSQHGFRAGHSCLTQLLHHFDRITKLLEEGKNVDVVYLDFAKAFDKVDFTITLQKLANMGVAAEILQWIRSFITGRNQTVYVDGQKSIPVKVLSGVPQGSVVGPLLFIVMLYDIDSTVVSASVSSFADDTRVLSGVTSQQDTSELQADLDRIYQWAEENNATFNPDKFECLRYGSDETLRNNTFYLSCNGSLICNKTSVKDLGVTMSANASFEEHISNITLAASLQCGWILRTFATRDQAPLITLYKTLVIPILDYCSQLWCPSSQGTIQRVEKVQINYLKKVQGISHLDYWQQLQLLKMKSLERRRERYRAIYVWKVLEDLVPNFGITSAYSKRNGRYCVVPHLKSNASCRIKTIRFNSMGVNGPRVFNSLPVHLRNMSLCSLEAFKRALDKHLEVIPDEPRVPGLVKFCKRGSNSLVDY